MPLFHPEADLLRYREGAVNEESVGNYRKWRPVSDHAPLIADVANPTRRSGKPRI
jgi:hypothetical protein